MMFRRPGNPLLPLLLAQGKFASSIFSLFFFFGRAPYLVCLANAVVDAGIGALVLWLASPAKKARRIMANLTLKLLLAVLPLAGRKKGLQDLFRLTAAAFGREVPGSARPVPRRNAAALRAFTRSEAEKAMAQETSSSSTKRSL